MTRKLLLLRCLPVYLRVSSMLKLRLPQFSFYRTAPFFPWSVGIQSNCCNTLRVLRYLFMHFQWRFAQKRKLAFWKTIFEILGMNYSRHFSGSRAWFGNHKYRLNQLVLAPSLLRSYLHKYHKWYFWPLPFDEKAPVFSVHHFFENDRHIKEALDQVSGRQNLYRLLYLDLSQ